MLLERGQRQTPTATLGLLPSGAKGTRATLRLMQRLVRTAMRDTRQFPILRRVTIQATRRLPQKDKRGELAALFDFVQNRIRYINDPRGIETLQTPLETLQLGAGDCDDKAMLLATLAELAGYATRFVAIGNDPERFSHVYIEVKWGDGWLPMDATEPHGPGWAPPGAFARMIEHV